MTALAKEKASIAADIPSPSPSRSREGNYRVPSSPGPASAVGR